MGHLVMSTLHLYSGTSIGCGLGITSISSNLCLSVHACSVSLLAITLIISRVIISNVLPGTITNIFVIRYHCVGHATLRQAIVRR